MLDVTAGGVTVFDPSLAQDADAQWIAQRHFDLYFFNASLPSGSSQPGAWAYSNGASLTHWDTKVKRKMLPNKKLILAQRATAVLGAGAGSLQTVLFFRSLISSAI